MRGRLLLGEALGGAQLGALLRLARRVVLFTLVAETAGARERRSFPAAERGPQHGLDLIDVGSP